MLKNSFHRATLELELMRHEFSLLTQDANKQLEFLATLKMDSLCHNGTLFVSCRANSYNVFRRTLDRKV
jgi:hypothetical protein